MAATKAKNSKGKSFNSRDLREAGKKHAKKFHKEYNGDINAIISDVNDLIHIKDSVEDDIKHQMKLEMGIFEAAACVDCGPFSEEDKKKFFAETNLDWSKTIFASKKNPCVVHLAMPMLYTLLETDVEPGMEKGGGIKGACKRGLKIQTLLFDKEHWTKAKAKNWLKKNDFKYGGVDEKENTLRFRQEEPSEFDENSFRTSDFHGKLPKGIQAVTGCPKKKHEDGGSVDGYVDLSFVVPSKIEIEETKAMGYPDKLRLLYNNKRIAQFYFNMRGYNQDFSLKNKENVGYGFGGDRSKTEQIREFKKALKDGYVFIRPYYEDGGELDNVVKELAPPETLLEQPVDILEKGGEIVFTSDDSFDARADGWSIRYKAKDGKPHYELTIISDLKFQSFVGVAKYLIEKAKEGSALHEKALAFIKNKDAEEWAEIEKAVPSEKAFLHSISHEKFCCGGQMESGGAIGELKVIGFIQPNGEKYYFLTESKGSNRAFGRSGKVKVLGRNYNGLGEYDFFYVEDKEEIGSGSGRIYFGQWGVPDWLETNYTIEYANGGGIAEFSWIGKTVKNKYSDHLFKVESFGNETNQYYLSGLNGHRHAFVTARELMREFEVVSDEKPESATPPYPVGLKEVGLDRMATGGEAGRSLTIYSPLDNKLLSHWRSYSGNGLGILKGLGDLKRHGEAIFGEFGLIKYRDFIESLSENDLKIIALIANEWNWPQPDINARSSFKDGGEVEDYDKSIKWYRDQMERYDKKYKETGDLWDNVSARANERLLKESEDLKSGKIKKRFSLDDLDDDDGNDDGNTAHFKDEGDFYSLKLTKDGKLAGDGMYEFGSLQEKTFKSKEAATKFAQEHGWKANFEFGDDDDFAFGGEIDSLEIIARKYWENLSVDEKKAALIKALGHNRYDDSILLSHWGNLPGWVKVNTRMHIGRRLNGYDVEVEKYVAQNGTLVELRGNDTGYYAVFINGEGGVSTPTKKLNVAASDYQDELQKYFIIPNNYEGKTAAQIWNAWDEQQRMHFLNDHYVGMGGIKNVPVGKIVNLSYSDLDSSIQSTIQTHTQQGQYAKGGKVVKDEYFLDVQVPARGERPYKKTGFKTIEEAKKFAAENLKNGERGFICHDTGGSFWEIVDGFAFGGEIDAAEKSKLSSIVRGSKYKIGLHLPFRIDFYLRAKEGAMGMGSIMLIDDNENKGNWSVSIFKYDDERGGYYDEVKSGLTKSEGIDLVEKIIRNDGKVEVDGGDGKVNWFGGENFGKDPRLATVQRYQLDPYEIQVYDDMTNKGRTHGEAIQLLINQVEGSHSQLSKHLAKIAKVQDEEAKAASEVERKQRHAAAGDYKEYENEYGKVKGWISTWNKGAGEYDGYPVVYGVQKNNIGDVDSYLIVGGILDKDGELINVTEEHDDWFGREDQALEAAKELATNEHAFVDYATGGKVGKKKKTAKEIWDSWTKNKRLDLLYRAGIGHGESPSPLILKSPFAKLHPAIRSYIKPYIEDDSLVYAEGGKIKELIVSKISDIPGLQKKVDAGEVTYRGLGIGKLMNRFWDASGGKSGCRIKVDGKEYYITDTDFYKLGGLKKMRFDAPYRRSHAEGGKVESTNAYDYMLLNRLQSDCDYFLGHGNRSEKHLWAGNVHDQIEKMKSLWNSLTEKPEWLSMEDILDYERKMKNDITEEEYKTYLAEGGNVGEKDIKKGDLVFCQEEGHNGLVGLVVSDLKEEDGVLGYDVYFRGLNGATIFEDKNYTDEIYTGGKYLDASDYSITEAINITTRLRQAEDNGDIMHYSAIAKKLGIELNPKYQEALNDYNPDEFATGGGLGTKYKRGDFVFAKIFKDESKKVPFIVSHWSVDRYYILGDGSHYVKEENLSPATEKDFEDYYGEEIAASYRKEFKPDGIHPEVGGWKLVHQTWSKANGGNGVSGTIRTFPENYYVATIESDGKISFSGIESLTRDIDKEKVSQLWESGSIPKEKNADFAKGGSVEITYKGTTITKQFPSGMYEFYSDKQGRFIKCDTLSRAKEIIAEEAKKDNKFEDGGGFDDQTDGANLRWLDESVIQLAEGGGVSMTSEQFYSEDGQKLTQLEQAHRDMLNRHGYYSKGVAKLAHKIQMQKEKMGLIKKLAEGGDVKVYGTDAEVEKMYLDYVNNFLTVEAFADHYNISKEKANRIIELGNDRNIIAKSGWAGRKTEVKKYVGPPSVVNKWEYVITWAGYAHRSDDLYTSKQAAENALAIRVNYLDRLSHPKKEDYPFMAGVKTYVPKEIIDEFINHAEPQFNNYDNKRYSEFDADDFKSLVRDQSDANDNIVSGNKLLDFVFPKGFKTKALQSRGSGLNENAEFIKWESVNAALYDIWKEIVSKSNIGKFSDGGIYYKGGKVKKNEEFTDTDIDFTDYVDVLDEWGAYCREGHAEDDDFDEFDAWLDREYPELDSKVKTQAVKEFYRTHPEHVELAKGGNVDSVKDYDGRSIPQDIMFNGKQYTGEAAYINGYNGYTSTKEDGMLCAVIDNSLWNGKKANLLTDKDGFYIRKKGARGQFIQIESGSVAKLATGGEVKIPRTTFFAKVKPLREGYDALYVRVAPDSVGAFTAGYVVYHPANSNKKAGYFNLYQFEDLIKDGDYTIIDKSDLPKMEDGGEPVDYVAKFKRESAKAWLVEAKKSLARVEKYYAEHPEFNTEGSDKNRAIQNMKDNVASAEEAVKAASAKKENGGAFDVTGEQYGEWSEDKDFAKGGELQYKDIAEKEKADEDLKQKYEKLQEDCQIKVNAAWLDWQQGTLATQKQFNEALDVLIRKYFNVTPSRLGSSADWKYTAPNGAVINEVFILSSSYHGGKKEGGTQYDSPSIILFGGKLPYQRRDIKLSPEDTPSDIIKKILPFKDHIVKFTGEGILVSGAKFEDGGNPKDFFQYVKNFYGKDGIYHTYFEPDGASDEEINDAIVTVVSSKGWGGGDSADRKRVRDIMLAKRNKKEDGGGASKWSEIKNGHVDDDGIRHIDAFLTDDENEQGKVIATVDKDGNVTYIDEDARKDYYAQELINDAIASAKAGEYARGGNVEGKYGWGVYVYGGLNDTFSDELLASESARLLRDIHPEWKIEVRPLKKGETMKEGGGVNTEPVNL